MTATENLARLGLEVPPVATPVGQYVPATVTGALAFTSGQLPLVGGALHATGKVGAEVSVEDAAKCAELAALNALAAVAHVAGGLDHVGRLVKVVVFVASDPAFTDQAVVANGASELLGNVFGEDGRHARSAVGVAVLPKNSPVEVELIVEIG
ncbi:MAG: RidA family protein [Propionibacteriaceae bacterium]|jgi:enamine deaminase RidA (YjgF/YER057c/UK114 family)|nr:RidA family protein [Propionibacteriaceae bacterium]